jgi:hypothetical protein
MRYSWDRFKFNLYFSAPANPKPRTYSYISFLMQKRIKFPIVLLLFFSCGIYLAAQEKKFALLDAKDPLTGEWEWVRNDTSAPFAPIPGQDWLYISFGAGSALSFGAPSWDETRGYDCASHFLAFSNGNTISATLSDACVPADKGKKISFTYQVFDRKQLIITYNDQRYIYKRKNAW